MNPNDPLDEGQATDEVFDSLIVTYEESLATDVTPAKLDESSVPPQLVPRLRSAQACLTLIHEARRARQQSRHTLRPDGARNQDNPLQLHTRPIPNERVGRFRLLREIGRGGYGVVFLAHDDALHRQVALKVPRPEVVFTPELSRRFLREAQAAGSLAHPNLVAVYEVGEEPPFFFIASEYCEGPNLSQWLKMRTEAVAFLQAAALVAAIADGVEEAHRRGILHRDIKPSNVLLEQRKDTASGRVTIVPKLTDFGLAKLVDDAQDETRTHALLGTPAYMSPEQAGGKARQIGPVTDVYALGALLYELLTGVAPFRGESDVQVLRQIVDNEPVRPALLRPGLPRDLEAICLMCLEKEPSRRYASAQSLAADLRRFVAGQPTLARPLSWIQRTDKWVRRRPAVAGLAGVSTAAVVLMVLLTGIYIWQLRAARRVSDDLRSVAEANAQESRKHELDANQLLYVSRMRLAYQWLEQGDIERVAELLKPYDSPGPLAHLRGFEWFHLKRRNHGERATLRGHEGEVYAVAFSPNGRELTSGGQDGTIRFWDPTNGEAVTTVRAHDSCVNALAYSPDGSLLASGSCDHTIKLWNPATRELAGVLPSTDHVLCLAFSPADGNLLATGGDNQFVNVWDVPTGEIIRSIDTAHHQVVAVAWRFDGSTVMFLSTRAQAEGTAVEVDMAQGREVSRQLLYGSTVAGSPSSAEFSVGLFSGGLARIREGAVEILASGSHHGRVHALAYSQDGKRLASGNDRTIRLRDTSGEGSAQVLNGHSKRVQSLAFSLDDRLLASASFDGTVKLWDLHASDQERVRTNLYTVEAHAEDCVAISPDLQRLALPHDEGIVRVWNTNSGSLEVELPTAGTPSGLHFVDNGRALFAAGLCAGETADEWDFERSTSRKTHRLPAANLASVALSQDGATLVTADWQTIELRDTTTLAVLLRQQIRSPEPGRKVFYPPRLCCSPNGMDMAISSEEDIPSLLIQAGDGNRVQELVPDVRAISNGAELLATASRWIPLVNLVDRRTNSQLATLRHENVVMHAAFSPDARALATVCDHGTVWLWNVRTGQEITRFETHLGIGVRVQFSANGRQLAAVTKSGGVAKRLPDGNGHGGSTLATAHLFIWNAQQGD